MTVPDTVRAPGVPAPAGAGFFRRVPPGLFASVMGTGIVATLATRFEWASPVFREFGTAVWLLAAVWLIILSIGLVGEWTLHRHDAVQTGRTDAALPFYGTVPMAILTVGAGTLLYGPAVLGPAGPWIAAGLWTVGTVLGVITAVGVPIAAVLSADGPGDYALPCWILPVVPPMVSATTGAGLLGHIDSEPMRTAMQALCYGLFGMALVLALMTLTMIYHRLLHIGTPVAGTVPTVWIPLGVIGQSIAAANLLGLGNSSATVAGAAVGPVLRTVGIGFGVVMLGFALFWILFASALTAHGTEPGTPFSLSWWSLVFPIGATTLGLSALGEAADSRALEVFSLCLYGALVLIWAVVATRSLIGGHLCWWRSRL
ncbi:TDT family transporter [Mycobacterium sp. SMC-4]|uniref:TDT family transporter n=1 Tax=Mycobacterium sp. SMC-4 TaxID=2857059 RepID=UPI003CFBD9A3